MAPTVCGRKQGPSWRLKESLLWPLLHLEVHNGLSKGWLFLRDGAASACLLLLPDDLHGTAHHSTAQHTVKTCQHSGQPTHVDG